MTLNKYIFACQKETDLAEATKANKDPPASYRETLTGGNADKGSDVFHNHQGAQCTRCHTIWEWGGDAGPVLKGVGERLSRQQILESLVVPSAAYSPGYGVFSLEMRDGEAVAGIVASEDETILKIKIGKWSSFTLS